MAGRYVCLKEFHRYVTSIRKAYLKVATIQWDKGASLTWLHIAYSLYHLYL